MKKKYSELYSDEFIDFCLKNIVPLCQRDNRIQKERKKDNDTKTAVIISIILIIISFIMIFGLSGIIFIFFYLMFLLPIVFIGLIVFMVITQKQIYTQKENIYPLLFSFYGKDCEYLTSLDDYQRMRTHIERLKFYDFETNFYIESVEDIFRIKYKNLDIEMCEFFAKGNKEDSQDDENNGIKYGSNIFFKIKRKNQSKERTIITRCKKQTIINNNKELINLESTDFNKLFRVYSTSQIEARKILTPLFMDKLIDFCFLKQVSSINISINKGEINIIISHNKLNLFEASYLFKNKKSRLILNLRKILIEHRKILSLLDELGIEHLSRI